MSTPGKKAHEEVRGDDVLSEIGSTKVQPAFVQRAGLKLAWFVGSIIAGVTLCVLIFLCLHYPSMPSAELLKEPGADSAKLLEQYKELSAVAIKSAQDLFHTFVTQALLPVFTAILGYIFAKGESKDDNQG